MSEGNYLQRYAWGFGWSYTNSESGAGRLPLMSHQQQNTINEVFVQQEGAGLGFNSMYPCYFQLSKGGSADGDLHTVAFLFAATDELFHIPSTFSPSAPS